jgi:hypothetical protein
MNRHRALSCGTARAARANGFVGFCPARSEAEGYEYGPSGTRNGHILGDSRGWQVDQWIAPFRPVSRAAPCAFVSKGARVEAPRLFRLDRPGGLALFSVGDAFLHGFCHLLLAPGR